MVVVFYSFYIQRRRNGPTMAEKAEVCMVCCCLPARLQFSWLRSVSDNKQASKRVCVCVCMCAHDLKFLLTLHVPHRNTWLGRGRFSTPSLLLGTWQTDNYTRKKEEEEEEEEENTQRQHCRKKKERNKMMVMEKEEEEEEEMDTYIMDYSYSGLSSSFFSSSTAKRDMNCTN